MNQRESAKRDADERRDDERDSAREKGEHWINSSFPRKRESSDFTTTLSPRLRGDDDDAASFPRKRESSVFRPTRLLRGYDFPAYLALALVSLTSSALL